MGRGGSDMSCKDYELPAIVGEALFKRTFPSESLRSLDLRVKDAEIALDAIPDGWAKVGQRWVRLVEAAPYKKASHGRGCWFQNGGPCDCTLSDSPHYKAVRT